jgi:flagellar biosynthetic protein FliP
VKDTVATTGVPVADDAQALGLRPSAGTPALGPIALGLLAVAALFLLWRRRGGAASRAKVLEPIGSCALGPRRHATLLRVGSRVVLVGVSDGGVRPLGEWDASVVAPADAAAAANPPEIVTLAGAPPAAADVPGGDARFARLLARAGLGVLLLLALPVAASAQAVNLTLGGAPGWEPGRLTTVVEIAALVTAITLLPALVLTATCFTRFVIVFHFVRQALGVPETPPNQVLVGLSLFLTAFVMAPVGERAWAEGVKPYRDGEIAVEDALQRAATPLKEFMLRNTRHEDLALTYRMSKQPLPHARDQVSLRQLLPAFVISELNTAFTAGFLIFLPFLVIDLLVSAVLLSMGMMMMPPVMVSMPLKVLVFILAGGWNLLIGSFVASVR